MFEGFVCRELGWRDFLGACQASGSTLLNVSQRPCLAVTRISSDNGGRASGSPGGELSACPRGSGWAGALQNGAAHLLAVTAPLAFHGVPSARWVRAGQAAESAVWGHMGSTESGPDARAFSENTSCHNSRSVGQVHTGQGSGGGGGSSAGTSQTLLWIAGSRPWGRDHLASLH